MTPEQIEKAFAESTKSSCSFYENCLADVRDGKVEFRLVIEYPNKSDIIWEMFDGKALIKRK